MAYCTVSGTIDQPMPLLNASTVIFTTLHQLALHAPAADRLAGAERHDRGAAGARIGGFAIDDLKRLNGFAAAVAQRDEALRLLGRIADDGLSDLDRCGIRRRSERRRMQRRDEQQ